MVVTLVVTHDFVLRSCSCFPSRPILLGLAAVPQVLSFAPATTAFVARVVLMRAGDYRWLLRLVHLPSPPPPPPSSKRDGASDNHAVGFETGVDVTPPTSVVVAVVAGPIHSKSCACAPFTTNQLPRGTTIDVVVAGVVSGVSLARALAVAPNTRLSCMKRAWCGLFALRRLYVAAPRRCRRAGACGGPCRSIARHTSLLSLLESLPSFHGTFLSLSMWSTVVVHAHGCCRADCAGVGK